MIKTILSTLILATFSLTASAEYTMRVPLEVAQGGTLPNGSVTFKTNVAAPVEPEVQLSHIEKCGNILTGIDSSFSRVGITNSYQSNSIYLWIADFTENTNISPAGYQMMADKGVDVLCGITIGDFKSSYYDTIPLSSKLSDKISYLNLLDSKMATISNGGVGNTISFSNDLASIRSQANDGLMNGLISSIINNPSFNGIKARKYYNACYAHSGGVYTYCSDGVSMTNFQAQMYITNNAGTINNYYSSHTLNFEVFRNNTFD